MAVIFGPGADIIWHGGTEYGSHIMSGRTKYGCRIRSRTICGCHNWSAGHFLGICAVTGTALVGRNPTSTATSTCILLLNNMLDQNFGGLKAPTPLLRPCTLGINLLFSTTYNYIHIHIVLNIERALP